MAKVKGPLHCIEATGRISQSQIFRNRKGIKYSSKFYFPGSKRKYTPSASQIAQRAEYKRAAQEWSNLTLSQKQEYIDRAKGQNYRGYNLYIKENIMPTYAILGKLILGQARFGTES